MKINTQIIAGLTIALLAVVTSPGNAAQPGKKGTDVLHFSVRKAFVNEGVETGVVGSVDAKQNTQGNADQQRLDLVWSGLVTNVTYRLYAVVELDDTDYIHVAEFAPNAPERRPLS